MYLIAGLGNPGPEYKDTRHNIGFRAIDLLSQEIGVRLNSRRFQSRNCRTNFHGKEVILLRPKTFMNLSGKSIKSCADFYSLKAENILIVHDDLDLLVGKIKVVRYGGAGGHKGVQSIIDQLGDMGFPRVKIGIGRPRHGEAIEDYVLSPFYDDQKDPVKRVIQMSVRVCQLFILKGLESAINHINNYQNLEDKEGKI